MDADLWETEYGNRLPLKCVINFCGVNAGGANSNTLYIYFTSPERKTVIFDENKILMLPHRVLFCRSRYLSR